MNAEIKLKNQYNIEFCVFKIVWYIKKKKYLRVYVILRSEQVYLFLVRERHCKFGLKTFQKQAYLKI